ncbi:MAG: hypothetical protein J4N87_04535 [Chloroflexi bacterium]|nr:hypothetical protein [Chloroflexota bacterium]
MASIAGAAVATGTAVGAGPEGALVALGALGAEVADGLVAAASGVAVADDPQATKNKSAIINDDNRMEPGFLKLWNMISEPPKFKTARIPRSPSRIINRMGCINFR